VTSLNHDNAGVAIGIVDTSIVPNLCIVRFHVDDQLMILLNVLSSVQVIVNENQVPTFIVVVLENVTFHEQAIDNVFDIVTDDSVIVDQ
jgi:hypothetical protein